MRLSFKIASVVLAFLFAFLAYTMIYSTAKSYTVWFHRFPHAVMTADGRQIKGWLHSTRDHRAFFFTRADSDKPFTYDLAIAPSGSRSVLGCGTWVAPRFPVIPVGDVDPPCLSRGGGGGRNLTTGERSVSFVASDGVRLEAHW
jgi:hypothetical protein